ncbi:isochorismatase family protein [Maribellus sp. YY47]|uniref:cysteine hydrolase family protein n=1 Tax=Maribellus sp. YY47 TaxID=2929486 RepID=UPI0020018A60|nr:isochorismatase family protein [Maribellus sp. YY47]MCK3682919.1 isochorismatase family protein [Maribellus sp. YY47]
MRTDVLFWNVDTQVDFMEPDGKLYAPGAETIKPVLKKLTDFAASHNIRVVNTADFHYKGSAELSANPDFIHTFPEHCMANTAGAEYVAETIPQNPLTFDWEKEYSSLEGVKTAREIVIRKDAFDVFKGNPYTDEIVRLLSPQTVMVYGVTTNVCVNDAVLGLVKRVKRVYVVEDAIKELPNIPLPFENWKKLGVQMIRFEQLKELIEKERR